MPVKIKPWPLYFSIPPLNSCGSLKHARITHATSTIDRSTPRVSDDHSALSEATKCQNSGTNTEPLYREWVWHWSGRRYSHNAYGCRCRVERSILEVCRLHGEIHVKYGELVLLWTSFDQLGFLYATTRNNHTAGCEKS